MRAWLLATSMPYIEFKGTEVGPFKRVVYVPNTGKDIPFCCVTDDVMQLPEVRACFKL